MAIFHLKSARDMYEKAQRELGRLNTERSVDNLFNFFVTAYHISDYVRSSGKVPEPVLKTFMEDSDLLFCQALCNAGKHMELTHKNSKNPHTAMTGALNTAPLNTMALNETGWVVYLEGQTPADLKTLPPRIMMKWDDFLKSYSL